MNTENKIKIWTACANSAGRPTIESTEQEAIKGLAAEDYYLLAEGELTKKGFRPPFLHFSEYFELESIVTAAIDIRENKNNATQTNQSIILSKRGDSDLAVIANTTNAPVTLRNYLFAIEEIEEYGLEYFLEQYKDHAKLDDQGRWYYEEGVNLDQNLKEIEKEEEIFSPSL
jgi:hypothetical protein